MKTLPIAMLGLLGWAVTSTAGAAQAASVDSAASMPWPIRPDAWLLAAIVLAVYASGAWRRRQEFTTRRGWRHAMFVAGVLSIFAATATPLGALADRLFLFNQIQQILLRIVGPLMIALAQPAPTLVAGLPRRIRRGLLRPVLQSTAVRDVYRRLGGKTVATLIYIVPLYLWAIPAVQDATVRFAWLSWVEQVVMLASGLLFLLRVFDPRPPPKAIAYGWRLMMLWISILASLVLGAILAIKPIALYHAYDAAGRLGMDALSDERFGGVLIWIPSSLMFLLAVILVIDAAGRYETYVDAVVRNRWTPSNSAALQWPTTGAELIARARVKNRQMAVGFTGFTAMVFVSSILAVVMVLALEHHGAAQAAMPGPAGGEIVTGAG